MYRKHQNSPFWLTRIRSFNSRGALRIVFEAPDSVWTKVLSRHGRGHSTSPTDVNYRANIWALKSLGVTHILAATCCRSLRLVGWFVFPRQDSNLDQSMLSGYPSWCTMSMKTFKWSITTLWHFSWAWKALPSLEQVLDLRSFNTSLRRFQDIFHLILWTFIF